MHSKKIIGVFETGESYLWMTRNLLTKILNKKFIDLDIRARHARPLKYNK